MVREVGDNMTAKDRTVSKSTSLGCGRVVLLTGAPATGKSSLAKLVKKEFSDFEVVDYGELLLREKQSDIPRMSYPELRSRSSKIVDHRDVAKVDESLIQWVAERRKEKHILIDTHGVTKEGYGFRLTPFDYKQVAQLEFDAILSLVLCPSGDSGKN